MTRLVIILCMSFLAGCGAVGNKVMSDSSLQKKAAFALNTTADQVVISNRTSQMDSIHFVAQINKKSYQCYVSTLMGVYSSDAICSGSSSVKSNDKPCDKLSKAANRC